MVAILLAGCAAGSSPIAEPGKVRLEWKLREGDRFTWTIRTTVHSAPEGEGLRRGQIRLARQETSIDGVFKALVLDRKPDGEVRARLSLESVRVKDLSEGVPSEFEWADGAVRKSTGEIGRLYAEEFRKSGGQTAEMLVSRQGRVRFSPDTPAAAKESLAQISGIVALAFPEKPLAPGDSWEERYQPVKSVVPFPEIVQRVRWEKRESAKGLECAVLKGEGNAEEESYGFKATAASTIGARFAIAEGILVDYTRELTLRIGEESEGESGWKVRTVWTVQFAKN